MTKMTIYNEPSFIRQYVKAARGLAAEGLTTEAIISVLVASALHSTGCSRGGARRMEAAVRRAIA